MTRLTVGPLTLSPDREDTSEGVYVQINASEDRDLVWLTHAEWLSLQSAASALADAERKIADAYQRGKDDLRAIIDALPGPAVGDDPVAVAKRWNGDSGTREPDFDMNPDDTASFLASHVIEMAARIAELEANAVRMREYRFALEGIATDGKGNPVDPAAHDCMDSGCYEPCAPALAAAKGER